MTYQSYLNGIENGLYNAWDVSIRTGYLLGQPTNEIVRNVLGGVSQIDKLKKDGTIKSLRNSIYSNTRTVLQSLANETRTMIFEENEKYFSDDENRYEYLATLDNRTCLVCGSLDGSLFKNIRDVKYQLPKHRGCRCIVLPYFEIEGDKKSSKNGYVDSKVTFNDWLKVQDKETQLDVLGRTRFELFKNGIEIKSFIDNGKIITIKDAVDSLKLNDSVDFAKEKIIEIPDEIISYENKIFPYKKEVGLVHTQNGENYIITGDENSINLNQIDKSFYKNCIFTHNHPNKSPTSSADLLSYNAYEMKIHRTIGYYKSKPIVIQIQRDISKKNMTEKFVNEVKKMESISNKQIELLTSIYQHKAVTDLQLAHIYTKIIDRMYDFYLNESRKYNYFVSVKEA